MRTVPALSRGLQILATTAESPRPLGIGELVSRLNLPRSATYELVHTLVVAGALEQTTDGLVIGQAAYVWGAAYARGTDIVRAATAVADDVRDACDETTQIAILDGRSALYVAKADSTQMLRLVSAIGQRVPAHCTALGKVLLAYLEPTERVRRLSGEPLEALTSRSITDLTMLEVELTRVRARGYALDNRESNPDVCCVAAPIFDASGTVVAAISIAVPATRFDVPRRASFRDIVLGAAGRLSAVLGFVGDEAVRHSAG